MRTRVRAPTLASCWGGCTPRPPRQHPVSPCADTIRKVKATQDAPTPPRPCLECALLRTVPGADTPAIQETCSWRAGPRVVVDGGQPGRQVALTRSAEQKARVSATCGCTQGKGCAREACGAPVTFRDLPAPHLPRPPHGTEDRSQEPGSAGDQENRNVLGTLRSRGQALHLPRLVAGLTLFLPHGTRKKRNPEEAGMPEDQADVAPPPAPLNA